MSKSLSFLKYAMMLIVILPIGIMAQSELLITWTGTPGEFENTIAADTLTDGTQAHDVYILEAGKIYLQITEINVNSSFTVRGQDANGGVPATIQPLPGADGLPAFTGWPTTNFNMFGENATLKLENLLFNGAFADQSTHLWSIAVPRGDNQRLVVENNVWSDYQLSFAAFGTNTKFYFNNSIVKACPSYPGGVFFNGFAWGAGSWMGTIDTIMVTNSSIMNMFGEAMVIYDQAEIYGLVDHCTFANIVMGVCFYRGQNNMTFSNNLFYNIKVYGQSKHDESAFGLWGGVKNGQGIIAILPQPAADSASIANGRGWDHLNRNISYHNNAWVNDQNVLDFYQTSPWQWDVTDSNGVTTTTHDTMLALSDQYKWVGDTTLKVIANDASITEFNNVQTTATLALAPEYINAIIPRIWDFRDDLIMQTYDNEWWQYEHDGNPTNVEWPIHEDLRYSASSPAATASETGGPVGDPRWDIIVGINDAVNTPKEFTLNQNYPNPFNPTTDIAFTLKQPSDIRLTIHNVLGQVVKTLVNESLLAGAYSYTWDGRDDLGNSVTSGVYLYTLNTKNKSVTKKMILMK